MKNKEKEFESLFAVHRDRLRKLMAMRMDHRLCERIDISDILQETYLEAYRRFQEYEPEKMPSYLWLRMIAGQKLVDLHRHHLHAKKRSILREVRATGNMPEASAIEMAAQFVGNMTSVSHAVMRAELRMSVEKALSDLHEMDREVLALRHFEQLTNAEISAVLGISPTAASNRYVRAVKRLRSVLPDKMNAD